MGPIIHENLLLPNGARRLFAHRGTQSDVAVLRQVFAEQHYSLMALGRGGELQDHYHQTVAAGRTPLIVDAGANIGASALYFAALFPQARIIALEPHAGNHGLLCANTAGLGVECHLAAIGSAPGFAHVRDNGFGEWGFQTERCDNATCPILPMAELAGQSMAAGLVPFIAKIDIEGAEADLFASSTQWVRAFPLITVELHDRMHPGKAISRNFLRCMAGEDRDFLYLHHNVFSVRNPPLQ